MDSGGFRANAEQWLDIAAKMLIARDLHGARTFAIRARESDPRLEEPNQILAVADTLLAAETRIITAIGNHHFDWYAILQLSRFTQSIELIATQYRKLVLLLNPERNRFPLSSESFRLVCEAWSVLSNPSRKIIYDNELQLSQLSPQPRQTQMPPPPPPPPPPAKKSPRSKDSHGNLNVEEGSSNLRNVTESTPQNRPINAEQTRASHVEPARPSRTESAPPARSEPSRRSETVSETASFWTACPYCYVLYEYPKFYEEFTLKCQNCKRAFHAVKIEPPPVTEKDTHFCCWGFYPLGFSGKEKGAGQNAWTPISQMFPWPKPGEGKAGANKNVGKPKQGNTSPRYVYYDEVLISDSESDPSEELDDDWRGGKRKKKAKNLKGKGMASRNVRKAQGERGKKGANEKSNVEGGGNAGSSSGGGRVLRSSGRKSQMGNGLDLNVEFSNEVEEPVAAPVVNQGGNEVEDNIDGVGFFEGLDEFLSSLPILNVVKDDKVKPT